MVCRLCPTRNHCWDKGNCENCCYAKVFENLSAKNKRLKEKNKALEAENKELKDKLDTILNHDF